MNEKRIHNTKMLKRANVISSRPIIRAKNTMVFYSCDTIERYTIPINSSKKSFNLKDNLIKLGE